jgi:hypothetical protein
MHPFSTPKIPFAAVNAVSQKLYLIASLTQSQRHSTDSPAQ